MSKSVKIVGRIALSVVAVALLWSQAVYWLIRVPGVAALERGVIDTSAWRQFRAIVASVRAALGAHGIEGDEMLMVEIEAVLCLLLSVALVWVGNRLINRTLVRRRRHRSDRITA